MKEGESGYCQPLQGLRCPAGVPCLVPGGWNRGQAVCRDCGGQWGRCLVADLEMTEQPVCPGCQSGRRWWGRGVLRVFSKPWMFSSLASPSLLRQLTLPDGSRSTWIERGRCLEAGRGWPWRPYVSIPLSRPSHKPFSVGDLWAAGCARLKHGDGPQALTQLPWWRGVGAALTQGRLE